MPNRPTLASLLAARGRHDVAAFVAALYDARGATTRVDSGDVLVDGDRYRVVESGPAARLRERFGGGPSASRSPDIVVAVDAGHADALGERYGVGVVTPVDLDRLARYGLDRPAADAVFRACFDCAVANTAPVSPTGTQSTRRATPAGGTPAAPTPLFSQPSVLVVLLVAAAVAFGAAAAPAVDPGVDSLAATDGLDGGGAGAGSGDPGAGADEAGVANEPRPTTTPTLVPDERRLAPGLSIDGVVDAEALATAHVRALSGNSYTWELTYVEFAGDNESGRATEVVTAENPTTYASQVETEGFLGARGPVAYRSSYADGDRLYRPTPDGVDSTSIEQRDPVGLQEARASQYYGILLTGEETSVVRTILGEPRLYVVDINGTAASSIRRYTATAHVAPDGLITYYSGSYCFAAYRDDGTRDTCITLTLQYRNVGQTSVAPPAWYTNASEPASPTTTTPTTTPTATERTTATDSGTETAEPTETAVTERHSAPV